MVMELNFCASICPLESASAFNVSAVSTIFELSGEPADCGECTGECELVQISMPYIRPNLGGERSQRRRGPKGHPPLLLSDAGHSPCQILLGIPHCVSSKAEEYYYT